MFTSYTALTFILATFGPSVSALPLNINLGAYSPALVVGDGEISFAGGSDVNSLMNALEGAAVETATAVTQQGAGAGTPTEGQNAAREQASDIVNILGEKKQNIRPRSSAGATRRTARSETAPAKRDIAGFDRALKFAEVALEKGPKVQLGTGAEGSGVGIIVDNNKQAASRPGRGTEGEGEAGAEAPAEPPAEAPAGGEGEAAAPAAGEKRDQSHVARNQPARRMKMTTMYVRSGVPRGLDTPAEPLADRDTNRRALSSRESDSAKTGFDSVNLNVPTESITMTFVEDDDSAEQ